MAIFYNDGYYWILLSNHVCFMDIHSVRLSLVLPMSLPVLPCWQEPALSMVIVWMIILNTGGELMMRQCASSTSSLFYFGAAAASLLYIFNYGHCISIGWLTLSRCRSLRNLLSIVTGPLRNFTFSSFFFLQNTINRTLNSLVELSSRARTR